MVVADKTVSCGKITMDKVLGLEITHASCDLCRDIHEDDLIDLGPIGGPEIVKKISTRHKLCDNVEWRLPRTHSEQLKDELF